MLILSRKCGQSIIINENIELVITEISGENVRIGIEAPKDVKVMRKELCQTVESNQQAAKSVDAKKLAEFVASFNRNKKTD